VRGKSSEQRKEGDTQGGGAAKERKTKGVKTEERPERKE